jgi:thiosulfate dehydrogenase (quinone) large subunit
MQEWFSRAKAVKHSILDKKFTTMNDQQQQVPGYLLTILRIYLGVILLYTVIGKLTASSPFTEEMLSFINFEIKGGRPAAFYISFLQSVVIPNAKLVSYLVMTGELIGGLGLLFGAFTRVCAIIAMVLFINYMLAKGRWFWSPDSEDAAVFFIALILFLGRAGRFFSLDIYLAKLWPGLI